ncbi:unnamed protein product [Sphenostylis stenocarpa]|uniref:Uncharacterized protein n=1 Tax=Sphenostylis stenocarpa TaxID=92480 RepID=A0AA86VDT7_9FABA|nr:unnamed protein product [Sphenostylis stenocarpa]
MALQQIKQYSTVILKPIAEIISDENQNSLICAYGVYDARLNCFIYRLILHCTEGNEVQNLEPLKTGIYELWSCTFEKERKSINRAYMLTYSDIVYEKLKWKLE